MPRSDAVETARKFRQQLANEEAAAAERMGRIYSRIYNELLDTAMRLANDLADAETISREDILKMGRTRELLRQTREQAARFGVTIENEAVAMRTQTLAKGVDDALKLMEITLPEPLRQALKGSFVRLPADAIEAAAGLTARDSALAERLREGYGEYVAEQVEAHLLDGIAAGQGPGQIAGLLQRNLKEALGSGLTSALTTIRTAQIKSYQIANHATYLANDNVVKGWVWHAELDTTTCLSCIAMHGTVHELSETLDDHHNGRCAPLPITVSYQDLGLDVPEKREPIESGADWFERQSAATQREMMGPSMFDAWKAGKFEFRDLSQPYEDEIYGPLLRQASLKDLL